MKTEHSFLVIASEAKQSLFGDCFGTLSLAMTFTIIKPSYISIAIFGSLCYLSLAILFNQLSFRSDKVS